MVMFLSYIIAVILTIVLAIILYPISALFFIIGKIGYVLGNLADFIFNHTNSGIKKLWSDVMHTRMVRDDVVIDPETTVIDATPVLVDVVEDANKQV